MENSGESDAEPEPGRSSPTFAEDASGRVIMAGSVVKTLSLSFIKKSLPSGATEAEALKLADRRAIVHEISEDKTYIEIVGGNVISYINASAVVLENEGQKINIGDDTSANIGSFVKVTNSGQDWPQEKKEAIDRTGKIIRINKESNILVQFAWGPTLVFEASQLEQSFQDKVETKDSGEKWIGVGDLVQVSKSEQDFLRTQRKNRLPAEPSHVTLLGHHVRIKKIFIKAFSSSKPIQVSSLDHKEEDTVNADILSLAHVEDRDGVKIYVGDKVKVLASEKKVLKLEPYGRWKSCMENYLGLEGQVIKIGSPFYSDDLGKEVKCFCVKLKFYDGKSYYFNPKGVISAVENEDTIDMSETLKPWDGTIKNAGIVAPPTSLTLEMIEKDDLESFEILGEGSFGSVVRGTWRHSDGTRRRVAIKKIKLGNVKEAAVLKEANIQFSFDHPNIVKLFGIHQVKSGEVIRELWMVMNLIEGDDLFNLIFKDPQPHNRMTFDRKLKLCRDMSNALAYIHAQKYLHCDIKPQNMMIDKNSGNLFVCDFGITKFLGDMHDAFMTRVTQYTAGISGTLAYVPPECFKQDPITEKYKRPTSASDVWALGVVFYELFSERLFCDSWLKLLQNIATNNEKFVKKQIVNVPERVRAMVLKTLNFTPKLRPTAEKLYEYFEKF